MAVLGAFIGASGVVSYENTESALQQKLGGKKEYLVSNLQAFKEGYDLALEKLGEKDKA